MRRLPIAGLFFACVAVLQACDDSTGLDLDPILATDTVEVAAPIAGNESLPTALDITGDGLGGVQGGRFPELPSDALEWDFAVRIVDGRLSLVPAEVIGVPSNAALTEALTGETFEGLREIPGQSSLIRDQPIPLVPGAVYAARSREAAGGVLGVCMQFAKLTPLEVDQTTGRTRIRIVTNTRCGDPRLVPE